MVYDRFTNMTFFLGHHIEIYIYIGRPFGTQIHHDFSGPRRLRGDRVQLEADQP